MVSRISDEELAKAMAANFDEHGDDLALAAEVAAMTPEQRTRSENNLRHWVTQARAHIAAQSNRDDRAT